MISSIPRPGVDNSRVYFGELQEWDDSTFGQQVYLPHVWVKPGKAIMSLWPVEDETTRQWMGTLYREHFLNGKDTGESVRAASLQILRQRRAKHQSTHPFYWGAFIAAGDWH
jgi:CHAT domain